MNGCGLLLEVGNVVVVVVVVVVDVDRVVVMTDAIVVDFVIISWQGVRIRGNGELGSRNAKV